ncbi:MAG: cytochrome C [Burkholderiales bacterium]|nr:cytochrome C [Burkholderiales bacterium]MDE1927689.1 cytochrome C [Burkholderiales bacterium]MDE2158938.1 cytochrome C [Burkholderiales bacterium]MDE2505198.1 cytochrome C [Burkholderiales bacterium]
MLRYISKKTSASVAALVGGLLVLASGGAQAVPSFARQTGMACEACHTVFPELTPFGRKFKLNGYSVDNLAQVGAINTNHNRTLALNQIPPLSFMFQTSYTSTKRAVPDTQAGAPTGSVPADALAKNGQVLFPQQASLFYAGQIAPNFGAFVQMTYSGTSGSFGWDNTDIRYARSVSEDLLLGISFNNNPTVQDLWNSTPAWQSPFDQTSATAPKPSAATMIDGTLAGSGVAGLSAYLSWDNLVYAEFGAYRSAPAAALIDSTLSNVVSGMAPYFRLAYERQWNRNSWEAGVYGIQAKLYPGGGTALSGLTNQYRDVAVDTQYQYIGDENLVSVIATYISEKQTLDAAYAAGTAANPSNTLKTTRIGASYYYLRKYGGALGYFSTTGSADNLLYAPASLGGSNSGAPDSKGWRMELNWVPYENTKLALQYTAYSKFNGGSANYDGSNRDAKDNNTLYLLGWINY